MSFKKKIDRIKKTFNKHGLKKLWFKLAKSKVSPNQIALGAALGLFLSIIPTFGIGAIIALIIAWLAGFNLLATYLGSMIVNPITASFFYFIGYQIGDTFIKTTGLKGITIKTYMGASIFSIVASFLLYLAIYYSIIYHRKRYQ